MAFDTAFVGSVIVEGQVTELGFDMKLKFRNFWH